MNTDQSIARLLDELVSGSASGNYLHDHLDLILTWLANPDSDSVSGFREEYIRRNISVDILRGYVFFILQQKLFSNDDLQPHEILGLPRTSTKESVKVRYRKLMRVFHPDKAPGNIENFNSIAEKINLAYHQLTKTTDKAAYIKPQKTAATKKAHPSAGVVNDKVESQLARKVRHKFGSVKQFQLLFFGGVASLCLFVIVLLYLQSGDPQALQSYSSRANAQTDNTAEFENDALKADSTIPDITQEVEKDVNPESRETSANVDNASNLQAVKVMLSDQQNQEKDHTQSYAQHQETDETLDDEIMQNQSQVAAVENDLIQIKQTELKVEAKANDNHKSISDQSDLMAATADDKAQPLVDLLSDGLNINKPASRPVLPEVKDNDIKIIAETEPVQIKQNTPVETSNASTPEALAVGALQPEINETPVEHITEQPEIVPVKEVEVAALKKPSSNRFDIANVFEKRFARKFVIKYLESIEKGDMADIRRYLSNALIVDGIGKNKINYLKNTHALINQTSKRQYHVQFVGDVLRLDPGVFRVTITLSHTYVFKNKIISKDSELIKYDIKRYANGSEIINISSA